MKAVFSDWEAFETNAPFLVTGGGEDVAARANSSELNQYNKFLTVENAEAVDDMWKHLYRSINLCNAIVSKAPEASELTAAQATMYEAQARYLRAFDYFWLTRLWGEVLIVTTENQETVDEAVQSPVADIYDLIVADLQFAETNLDPEYPGLALPTKGAAKALLAEVYLNMAGWPMNDASKYALARDKAKEVMDMNMYSLEPNFGDLWLVANKFTNSEFLFFFNGDGSNFGTSCKIHQCQRPSEEGGWSDVVSEVRFYEAFPEGPRKYWSFKEVFDDAANTNWRDSRLGVPIIWKYMDAGIGGSRHDGRSASWGGDGFFPVSRYSEVLLIYAEAANMAEGGPSAAALEAINKVRRRAGGFDQSVYADLPNGMSQSEFDDAVIAERAWELAFEGKRWFDLVRKEMVVEANIDTHPAVREYHRLLPKFGTDVRLIEGLTQNEGYPQ
ncbi:MAG TPA: RagB/SusD family nutrient uptake outer membrane protein [Draconibacterium sp.]|nr:RagB/SusD family nutrient uptake outer membrane protein [Draconibacterium sp.]